MVQGDRPGFADEEEEEEVQVAGSPGVEVVPTTATRPRAERSKARRQATVDSQINDFLGDGEVIITPRIRQRDGETPPSQQRGRPKQRAKGDAPASMAAEELADDAALVETQSYEDEQPAAAEQGFRVDQASRQ